MNHCCFFFKILIIITHIYSVVSLLFSLLCVCVTATCTCLPLHVIPLPQQSRVPGRPLSASVSRRLLNTLSRFSDEVYLSWSNISNILRIEIKIFVKHLINFFLRPKEEHILHILLYNKNVVPREKHQSNVNSNTALHILFCPEFATSFIACLQDALCPHHTPG